ncbi:MAG: hypothetical protein ABIR91_05465 [Candidatus Saccharimonadales bacterium]
MRGGNGEQAQRDLDALGPIGIDWGELTLNERIERDPQGYFAEARVAVSIEAARQITDETAIKRKIAARALKATQ